MLLISFIYIRSIYLNIEYILGNIVSKSLILIIYFNILTKIYIKMKFFIILDK